MSKKHNGVGAKKSGPGKSWAAFNKTYCAVLNCSNGTFTCPELWFFMLPTHANANEARRRDAWLKNIGRAEISPHQRLLVCEKHFYRSEICGKPYSQRRRLRDGTVPTLFLPPQCSTPLGLAKPKHVYQRVNNSDNKVYNNTNSKPNEGSITTPINTITNQGDTNGGTSDHDSSNNLSKSSRTYSDEYKASIFKLYYGNTQAYKVLQSTLGLPPVSLLQSFIPSTLVGINMIYINDLKTEMSLMPLNHLFSTLCISKIRVRNHVQYDPQSGTISGVCEGSHIAPVQYAMIATVRGLNPDWHHIASITFLVSHNMFAEFNTWIDKLILIMIEIGINIKAIVTGTDDFFRDAFSLRDIYKIHRMLVIHEKKIYHIYDPLHLMLLLYDELKNYDVHFNETQQDVKKAVAKWCHISKLFKHDSTRILRFTNGSCSIDPNESQQNKLKLAAQILSLRTATGMSSFVDSKILPKKAMDTVDFIVRINTIFAALYPDSILPEYKNMQNKLGKETGFWQDNIMFLKSIECTRNNLEAEAKFAKCFITNLESIMSLQKERSIRINVSELTQYLNQEPLIELIEKIRSKSDLRNPTPNEFIEIIKDDLMQNNFHAEEKTNYNSRINTFIKKANEIIRQNCFEDVEKKTSIQSIENNDDYTQLDYEDTGSLLYVATYLLHKMYQKYPTVVSMRIKVMNSSVYYENREEGFTGSLIVPDNEFLNLVQNLDEVFVDCCKKAIASGNVFEELMKKMSKFISTGLIDIAPVEYVIGFFVNLRLHHTIKYNNDVYDREDTDEPQFVVRKLNNQAWYTQQNLL